MCKLKPRPRCRKHALTSLGAAERRYSAAREHYDIVTSAPHPARSAVDRATKRLSEARTNLAQARMDVDSTPDGQDTLRAAILNPATSDADRVAAKARLAAAQVMRASRAEQARLMPDLPVATNRASQLRDALGKDREALAYLDGHMAAAPDPGTLKALDEQRRVVEASAFGHDVSLRVVSSNFTPSPAHVLPSETNLLRDRGLDPETRSAVVYLSHVRAACASGAHDPRFDQVAADREQALTETLPPSARSASPYRPAREDDSAWDTRPANAPRRGQRSDTRRTRRDSRRGAGRPLLTAAGIESKMRAKAKKTAEDTVGSDPNKREGIEVPFLPEKV